MNGATSSTRGPGKALCLEAVDDFGDRTGGVRCNEQVHVVGHHLHLVHDEPLLSRDCVDQLLQSAINRRHQYRPPVLGAPHDVVLQAEHDAGVFSVAISGHASINMRRIINVNGDLNKGRALRCRLKPAVPGA